MKDMPCNSPGTALPPTGLICCLLRWPDQIELSTTQPAFGWIVNDSAPNQHQMAYQLLVASSLKGLSEDRGDMWDSGKWDPASSWTSNAQSLHVPYGGSPLQAHRTYWWKVRTWNSRNDVSAWSEAQPFVIGAADDPALTDRQQVSVTEEPANIFVKTGPCHAFVDFGKAAFGRLRLVLTTDNPGTLHVHLGEVAEGTHRINRTPGGSRRYIEIPIKLKPGTHEYITEIPSDPRNTDTQRKGNKAAAIPMPPHVGEVFPFRYCEFEGEIGQLEHKDTVRQSAWYPFDDDASDFRCSDPVLNDIWEFCKYSMKATSFCGVHVDGDRERIPYEADAYINQLGYCCCDREYALSRYTHEYLITNPTWPTEWVLFSVLIAWVDYEYTGDSSSLERFYEDLQNKALLSLARDDGLISTVTEPITDKLRQSIHFPNEMTPKDIVDWPQSERDDFDMRPVNTVVNAFHHKALCCLSRIAAAIQRPAESRDFATRAARVEKAMLACLTDPNRKLFVDGEGSGHCSLHANMFAAAFGLVPDHMKATVLDFLIGKGMACSVYGSQFLLDALYNLGAGDAAYSLLTSRSERGWAHMIYDVGTTISLEAWDDRFKPNQDWNHAWGAAPANLIPRWLMGIRPETPGFGKIRIHPQPGPLTYAEMRMPTIRGTVTVCHQDNGHGDRVLSVGIPANSSALIVLPPDTVPGAVCLDNRKVLPTKADQGWQIDGIGSGKHTIVYRLGNGQEFSRGG